MTCGWRGKRSPGCLSDRTLATLENHRAPLYAYRVESILRHFLIASTVAASVCLTGAMAPAQETAEPAATPPIVAFFDFERVGTPAFSFEVPRDWVQLSGATDLTARLDYVANLREVLDAPPDVPPGSFDRLLSFAGYWIPEINGYLIASVFDATVYPVQLFDVLSLHARGSNDWGESLAIRVEQVLRNERLVVGGNPALAIDVQMSGGLSIAAEYFQIPSTYHRVGGIVLLLPSSNRQSVAPLIDHIRASIQVGVSNDRPEPALEAYRVTEIGEAAPAHAASDIPPGTGEVRLNAGRLWNPPNTDEESITGAAVLTGLVVIAIAYPLVFFLTLRLIYGVVYFTGRFLSSAIDLEAYRKAAEANPWTMGLLQSERMIMITALVSMGLSASLLALFLQQS